MRRPSSLLPPPGAAENSDDETEERSEPRCSLASLALCTLCGLGPLALIIAVVFYEFGGTGPTPGLPTQSWVAAGICVLITIPVSAMLVLDHLRNYKEPRLQLLVVRILWMPVIFGVDNWMALRFREVGLYWTALTGWYEAWVLYSFYMFLAQYLSIHTPDGVAAEEADEGVPLAERSWVRAMEPHAHMAPCCLVLRPWRMDTGQCLARCKFGCMQYTVVQSLCTLVVFATEYGNRYYSASAAEAAADGGTGATAAYYGTSAYAYVTVAVNLSQIWALYVLVHFYHTFKEALRPIRPLPKFLCVKLVIFFSFWQMCVVYALNHFGVIAPSAAWANYDSAAIGEAVQQVLLCVEMMIAAFAHLYAFPPSDYETPPGHHPLPFGTALREMLSVADVAEDMLVFAGCMRYAEAPAGPPVKPAWEGEAPGELRRGALLVGEVQMNPLATRYE